MDWQQKRAAIEALGIRVQLSADWDGSFRTFVPCNIGGDGFLTGVGGHGTTPRAAVEDLWQNMTGLTMTDRHIYVFDSQRRVRWNGYMWEDVQWPRS